MSSAEVNFPRAGLAGELPLMRCVSFASSRLALAQLLVVLCFIWPFFNYDSVDPGNKTELNFLPVFFAVLLVPEVTLREKRSILLALPVFLVALIWANPTAPLRLAIGILPLHFILNLTCHLRERGKELIPPDLAYRTLQVFIAFSLMQTVQFYLFPVIPEWLTTVLITIVPRYNAMPYDDYGIRGVQGWASEPSGAALSCIAFAIVAIYQRPDRRWRVLVLYMWLLMLNKSIYCLLLSIILCLFCVFSTRRKLHSLFAIVPMAVAFVICIVRSGRLAELQANILTSGMSSDTNNEFFRIAQIFLPFQQFPRIYVPVPFIGNGTIISAEPIGLVPLLIGYGSLPGLIWLVYILCHNYPWRQIRMFVLMMLAALTLLFLAPSDLIPAIVAFVIFLVPGNKVVASC